MRSIILDSELVACDDTGKPDFRELMFGGRHSVCAWCFDLLHLNGRDLRPLPLAERRDLLRNLLIEADDSTLRFSDDFPDPDKVLGAASRMGLEGIVSSGADQPYRSGPNSGWIKVKTATWREANGIDGNCSRSDVGLRISPVKSRVSSFVIPHVELTRGMGAWG